MASPTTALPRTITLRQKILLGGLGVALVGVLLIPNGKSPETVEDSAQSGGRRRPSQDSVATAQHEIRIRWPDISLDDVLAHNPFGRLPTPDAAATTDSEPVAPEPPTEVADTNPEPADGTPSVIDQDEFGEAVRRLRVSLIVTGEKGPAAVIGNRIVHVGDLVDGCRIISISDAGVIVAPADSADREQAAGK